MSEVILWITLITEIVGLIGLLAPLFVRISLISEGTRCQLRSEMLRIYYKYNDVKKMRQFEHENFVKLYEAYKALKGNSFIDKIYAEVQTWEIEL
jgi:hypothetical protein